MKTGLCGILGLLCVLCVSVSTSFASTSGDLISLLVNQLGVTNEQATGGTAAVFKTAQDNLQADEYKTITTAMPEVTGWVEQAPVVKKESSDWMSSATSLMGDSGKKVNSASSLLDSFKSLGMDGDMVAQFTPIVLDYVQKNGGDICVNLMKSVL